MQAPANERALASSLKRDMGPSAFTPFKRSRKSAQELGPAEREEVVRQMAALNKQNLALYGAIDCLQAAISDTSQQIYGTLASGGSERALAGRSSLKSGMGPSAFAPFKRSRKSAQELGSAEEAVQQMAALNKQNLSLYNWNLALYDAIDCLQAAISDTSQQIYGTPGASGGREQPRTVLPPLDRSGLGKGVQADANPASSPHHAAHLGDGIAHLLEAPDDKRAKLEKRNESLERLVLDLIRTMDGLVRDRDRNDARMFKLKPACRGCPDLMLTGGAPADGDAKANIEVTATPTVGNVEQKAPRYWSAQVWGELLCLCARVYAC